MNRTKRRIFNTAVKLFSSKGYDNTSVEEITAIAGVAKGSLYYHFAKKEDILYMLLEEGVKLLKNNIEIKTKKCNTATEKIRAIVLIEVKVVIKYEDFLNVIFSEMFGKEEINIKCKEAVIECIKEIEKIIQEGIDSHEFYNGNVEAMASGVFGVTCSSLIYRNRVDKILDVNDVYEGYANAVINALKEKIKKER